MLLLSLFEAKTKRATQETAARRSRVVAALAIGCARRGAVRARDFENAEKQAIPLTSAVCPRK
jgi:hypothetical protein